MLAVEWLLVMAATLVLLALIMGFCAIGWMIRTWEKNLRRALGIVFIAVTLIVTLTLHIIMGPML